MKKFVNWLFNFCSETGELIMGAMALRYAWLIGHPEPRIPDSSTISIMQKVLKIAAPLSYWSFALFVLGSWQLLALLCDFYYGHKSIPLRKKASCWAMIGWGLISYSYLVNNQPLILSLTFVMFCAFCFFLVLVLRRSEKRHIERIRGNL